MHWLHISLPEISGIITTTTCIYLILLVMIRINGLRTFSKMSAHDFAVTIAIGSLIASTAIQKEPSILQGAVAMGTFIFLQALYSRVRIMRNKAYLENEPLLLMDGAEILHKNLDRSNLTENDLIAKLREANVLNINNVKAAILESTGDVSILHGDIALDEKLLQNVRRNI